MELIYWKKGRLQISKCGIASITEGGISIFLTPGVNATNFISKEKIEDVRS